MPDPSLLGGMGTPTWPPNAPPFSDLVRRYETLIHRSARRWGVRPADVPDCTQTVLLRFHRGIVEGRLDLSRPQGIGGWLKKTTRSVAYDLHALSREKYEILVTNDVLDAQVDDDDPETRLAEAKDVHDIVDRSLDKMSWEQREVFVMVDLEDTPMAEVLDQLGIPRSTAYGRLEAARATFAREWQTLQKSGALVAPLSLFSLHALLAAERALPDLPPGSTDDLLRRLGEDLAQDFLGPASGAVPAGLEAEIGAAANTAKAGSIALAPWQIGLGALLVGIAGAGLATALRPTGATPAMPTKAVLHEVSPLAPARPRPVDQVAPSQGAPVGPSPSAPPLAEVQTRFLANARALLKAHQPAKALTMLGRVTAPDLAEEREELRRLALGQLRDGGQP